MTTSTNQISIIGPGSRLAKAIGIRAEGREYSFRPGEAQLPERIEGTVLVFADPPSVELTRACFIDLLSRIPLGSGAHIVLISSISASNHASTVYPIEGPYAHRKRLAEEMVKSRTDLGHTIIRVGNVAEYGGWHYIFTACHTALLPSRCQLAAIAALDQLRAQVAEACAAAAPGSCMTLVSYVPTSVAKCFRRPLHVPGLFALYRARPTRLLLKVAAKLLMRAGIYLPSPDDLNAFLVQVE